MNLLSKTETLEPVVKMITEKAAEMGKLSKAIYENLLNLANHDKGQETIENKIDLLKFGLQKDIVDERDEATGKATFTNDLARKSELTIREAIHEPLKMLKADRLSHIETAKQIQALVEFQRRQFTISEKILIFLANQS